MSHTSQIENENELFNETFTTLIDKLEFEVSSAATSVNDKATLLRKMEILHNAIFSEVAPQNHVPRFRACWGAHSCTSQRYLQERERYATKPKFHQRGYGKLSSAFKERARYVGGYEGKVRYIWEEEGYREKVFCSLRWWQRFLSVGFSHLLLG